jgi:hypothetical protein
MKALATVKTKLLENDMKINMTEKWLEMVCLHDCMSMI